MEIVAGMLLLCNMVTHFDHGINKMFIKDVETKVHYITPKRVALIQYNLANHKAIRYDGEGEEMFELVNVDDLKSKRYMDCRSPK